MASMAISCVDFKTSPFLVNLNAGFFSAENNVKHGFLSSGTFTGATWLQALAIPDKFFFLSVGFCKATDWILQ